MRFHEITEKELRCIITSNARWHNATNASCRFNDQPHALRENSIGIHIPPATQRVTTTVTDNMALASCLPLIFHKHLVEFRSFMHECCYHLSALGSIGSIGDIWSARGKPFFFLDLDTLPWGIAKHDIEASDPA